MGEAADFSELFASLDAPLPSSLLKASNKIVVAAQTGTTITSVDVVTHRKID